MKIILFVISIFRPPLVASCVKVNEVERIFNVYMEIVSN